MRGIIHCEFRAGGTRIDHFNNLTRAAELTKTVAATFVLDNAPCHRSATNVDIGNNGIRFLPAYSPMESRRGLVVKALDSHARSCGFKSCLAQDEDYWWKKVTGAHLHKCVHSYYPLRLGNRLRSKLIMPHKKQKTAQYRKCVVCMVSCFQAATGRSSAAIIRRSVQSTHCNADAVGWAKFGCHHYCKDHWMVPQDYHLLCSLFAAAGYPEESCLIFITDFDVKIFDTC